MTTDLREKVTELLNKAITYLVGRNYLKLMLRGTIRALKNDEVDWAEARRNVSNVKDYLNDDCREARLLTEAIGLIKKREEVK